MYFYSVQRMTTYVGEKTLVFTAEVGAGKRSPFSLHPEAT